MKLQTRLSLLVSLVILATSTAIGFFAITTSYNSQLKILDSAISLAIDELTNSDDDPLSLATYLADQSSQKFSVDYITPDRDLIPLYESNIELREVPGDQLLAEATEAATTINQLRLRTFQISQGEYLAMSFSLFDLNQSRTENIKLLLIFTGIVISVGIFLTLLIFRRDNQLNELVNSLKLNQERIKEFIGDASHELRTPLTVIKGYFELLGQDEISASKKDSYNDRIESEIVRMQEIINDLLFITEIEESDKVDEQSSEISQLVDESVFDLRNLQPNRQILSEIEPGLIVKISKYHLEQLLGNIFSNIKRHTPIESQIEVTLKGRGGGIELIIEDSGSGLPESFYRKGIQAFQRFDKSRSRQSGGSGLGMTIMEKIVSKNRGQIRLSNSKFGGLKIQINLP
jgi:two-component system, OmpR family, sensor kinase